MARPEVRRAWERDGLPDSLSISQVGYDHAHRRRLWDVPPGRKYQNLGVDWVARPEGRRVWERDGLPDSLSISQVGYDHAHRQRLWDVPPGSSGTCPLSSGRATRPVCERTGQRNLNERLICVRWAKTRCAAWTREWWSIILGGLNRTRLPGEAAVAGLSKQLTENTIDDLVL
jgi:hypothetical protein